MPTQKDLIEAKKRLKDAQEKWELDPDYINATNRRYAAMQTAMQKTAPLVQAAESEVERIEKELAEQRSKKDIPLPKVVEEFFKALKYGVDWGLGYNKDFSLKWISDDERYIIWTWPSGSVWSGIGQPWHSYPSTHTLADLSKFKGQKHGSTLSSDTRIAEYQGRWNKEVLKQLLEKLPNA